MKIIRTAGLVAGLAAITLIFSSCVITVNKKAVRIFAKDKFVEASGVITTRDTTVSPFTKLSVSGPLEVTFTQSTEQPSVKITTSDNIQEYMEVKIEDNTLKVGLKDGPARISEDIKVEIVGPAADALKLAGSGELALKGSVSRRAKYSIAGSGHINAKDLKCPATSYETKGGSITYQDADGHLVKED